MKILLTGGGSGGHFYPIIAIAQALNKLTKEQKLINIQLYYMAPQPYDKKALFDNDIQYVRGSAGKMRRYFSLLNIIDYFKTGWGILIAMWRLYRIYPDVVFGKGGYVSFPALCAARFLRIPIVIHESDSTPGRVNRWAGKFARKIAVSYPEASTFFPKGKVAHTGNPIRNDIITADHVGGHDYLGLEKNIPTILILGGSQGSQVINDAILDALPQLVKTYQIIHQTGILNFSIVKQTAEIILAKSEFKMRYKPYDSLDSLTLRMAAGAAQVVVSRAGSTIFEIANWGIPAILIPITASNGDHQRKNAYSYARGGGADVIEENNLTGHILQSEISRVLSDVKLQEKMKQGAAQFARKDSADLIASEILSIAREHEV